ncbi:amidohydrolase family protein [Paraburkholderia graminis]|jgi:predicted TIM-barrel fold metal-dependent hydrolase|uniref:TIM-barrel fold metal-dependent hydrolase n=1 Tax=Paraburkholderia graminis TaxID=60548 RepID=A0ABD5CMH4_9BURK|nr:amidohydrolase family protein [Paraburkholderia graminis]MDQ0625107.1 putative TIM-barrel fold metal-dependent hydrolase [Paraburkholderia graminis]MDR6206263.1 putative TIM-barrel fold metal-dependent hydrolase [Paraburkholderia graminis]
MQVVDSHIHLWDLKTHRYPWLENPGVSFVGDARALKHDYLLDNLLAEAGDIDVKKLVHVEANHDPADPVEETRWLQGIADRAESRGMPNAIVAAVDLASPNAPAVLEAHASFANTRGVRQILNVHENRLFDYVGRHFMREPQWRENFALLRRHGMSFDLQLYPSQMEEAAALARAHSDTLFAVNHAGMFVDRSSVAGYRAWRDGLRMLAGCSNVYVKISGLAMFDHQWTVESLRPYLLETIDAFGAERAMFASNFPVDRLFGAYTDLWHAYAAIVEGASVAEKEALFCGNAERFYRI